MSNEKMEKKPLFCLDRLEPCVFRSSNQCVKCGRHRGPSFAVGSGKSDALAVQI